MIKDKKGNKPLQTSQKVVIPEELVMKNLESPEVLSKSQKVAITEPFNPNKIVLSNQKRFLNNSTREFLTPIILEEINKQPEGSIIKHAYDPFNRTIFFYAMKPQAHNSTTVELEKSFGAVNYDTKIFTPLNNVSTKKKEVKNKVLKKLVYNKGSEVENQGSLQIKSNTENQMRVLRNMLYTTGNTGNTGNPGKQMVVLENQMYNSGL